MNLCLTEAEAHLDVVWEDLKTNLNAIACVEVEGQVPERRVQGDNFHMMKRPRPATKHSYLHLYAEALSYAFFIRNAEDETKVMQREFNPKDIEKNLLHDNEYTRRRVRRTVRPVHEFRQYIIRVKYSTQVSLLYY
jgi:hypothetical protein